MLLFSLGPVQAFIAQARKTRDLWLGSLLLSALMQAGMEGIASKLIFPANPKIKDNIPDLPNKYIAIFPTLEEAEQAAKQSEEKIKAFWRNLCNNVWDKVLDGPSRFTPETRTQWDAQTDPTHVFELFWVVVAGEEEAYKDWLKDTQSLFDQRKRLRDFSQQIEVGEKSTISGQRAALRGKGEWRSDVQTFWRGVAIAGVTAKILSGRDISQDGTERLDAIDTVKRFAHLSDSLAYLISGRKSQDFNVGFPSTSFIATASFAEQLIIASEDANVAAALVKWKSAARQLNERMPATIPLLTEVAKKQKRGADILTYDGDCYFPETFSARRLEKEFGFDRRTKECERLAKDGPDAIGDLLRATDKIESAIIHPRSYYAMIQMDGDKMGTLINGVSTRKEHKEISRALSEFSRENVPALVEKHYSGRLIYAGGDDVFALAPLARHAVPRKKEIPAPTQEIGTVLDLVDELRRQYHEVVGDAVLNGKAENTPVGTVSRKDTVTASTGIAIAHHYTPLSYVRRVSKEAEKLAKKQYGRNALVVTVLRRSGEQTRVGCKWEYPGLDGKEEMYPIPLFLEFYTYFMDDVLSPSCVHTLLEEVSTLVGLLKDAQVSEIKRVLRRQRNLNKKDDFSDTAIATTAQRLVDLAEAMDAESEKHFKKEEQFNKQLAVELHAEERRYGLVEVLGWLLVMLFLARKEQE